MTRSRLLLLSLLVLGGMLGASAYHWRDALWQGWWEWSGARPLDEGDSAKLVACEPIGWHGVLRVYLQDLDTPCGEDQAWTNLSLRLRSEPRRRWLRAHAAASGSVRQRLRAALALSLDVAQPTPGLMPLLEDPALPPALEEAVHRAFAEERLPLGWAHPLTGRAVRLGWALEEREGFGAAEVSDALRWESAWPGQQRQAAAALTWAEERSGVSPSELAAWRGRREAGLGLGDAPNWVHPLLLRAAACQEVTARGCWGLRADLFEAWLDAESAGVSGWDPPVDAATGPAHGLLVVLHGPAAARLAERALDDAARWIAAYPPERHGEMAREVLASAGRLRAAPTPATAGDPVGALLSRGADAWGTALALQDVGHRIGAPVEIRSGIDGLVVRFSGETIGLRWCEPGAVTQGEGAALDVDALVAGAATQAASALGEADPRAADARRLAQRLGGSPGSATPTVPVCAR